MCVNFFFGQEVVWLQLYLLEMVSKRRTNYAFKKEVFLNRTQKRYHTEAAKANSKIA